MNAPAGGSSPRGGGGVWGPKAPQLGRRAARGRPPPGCAARTRRRPPGLLPPSVSENQYSQLAGSKNSQGAVSVDISRDKRLACPGSREVCRYTSFRLSQ